MDRREVLKFGATGTATALLAGNGAARGLRGAIAVRNVGTWGRSYASALDQLIFFVRQDIAAAGIPGISLCLVDAEGFVGVGGLGWADIDRRIPVGPSHLFQVGSISKSFAALCVYRLADEGKIDLDAPLSRYLPDIPLPAEPITVQQVLSHTSGLPRSAPAFPRVPDRRLWTDVKPGTQFSYSNTGFELIGMLVQTVFGKPYPIALRELVIEPLGIKGSKEVVQASDRALYAIGYSPINANGPNMTHVQLGQTQWVNFDTADANVGVTADSMAAYLQFLIAVGRGRGTPLFSDKAAKRFTSVLEPAAQEAFGKGAAYASGLEIIDLDGRRSLYHLGGTWGFTSTVTVDPVTGIACFACVNAAVGTYTPADIGRYACKLLRHVREGGSAPWPAPSKAASTASNAQLYVGSYLGPQGDRFKVEVRADRLFLTAGGYEARMEAAGEHKFVTDHPHFGSHLLGFVDDREAGKAAWYGAKLYGFESVVAQPAVPPELSALQGTYFSSDPLSGLWRCVLAQGERLVVENVRLRNSFTLSRKADYWHVESPENPSERLRFEDMMNGVPQRLSYGGRDLWRLSVI